MVKIILFSFVISLSLFSKLDDKNYIVKKFKNYYISENDKKVHLYSEISLKDKGAWQRKVVVNGDEFGFKNVFAPEGNVNSVFVQFDEQDLPVVIEDESEKGITLRLSYDGFGRVVSIESSGKNEWQKQKIFYDKGEVSFVEYFDGAGQNIFSVNYYKDDDVTKLVYFYPRGKLKKIVIYKSEIGRLLKIKEKVFRLRNADFLVPKSGDDVSDMATVIDDSYLLSQDKILSLSYDSFANIDKETLWYNSGGLKSQKVVYAKDEVPVSEYYTDNILKIKIKLYRKAINLSLLDETFKIYFDNKNQWLDYTSYIYDDVNKGIVSISEVKNGLLQWEKISEEGYDRHEIKYLYYPSRKAMGLNILVNSKIVKRKLFKDNNSKITKVEKKSTIDEI